MEHGVAIIGRAAPRRRRHARVVSPASRICARRGVRSWSGPARRTTAGRPRRAQRSRRLPQLTTASPRCNRGYVKACGWATRRDISSPPRRCKRRARVAGASGVVSGGSPAPISPSCGALSREASNTHWQVGQVLSVQVVPTSLATTRQCSEPAASRKLSRIGAAEPGTPSITVAPS